MTNGITVVILIGLYHRRHPSQSLSRDCPNPVSRYGNFKIVS